MERVNLLPEDARLSFWEKLIQGIDQQFPKVLLGLVSGLALFAVVLVIVQETALFRSRKRLEELKKVNQTLKVESKNMEVFSKQLDQTQQELQRQKKVLETKLTYIKGVQAQPRVWAAVLKDLRQNIPHGVWLTDLESGPEGALKIAGGAMDENLVTELMGSLKENPHFSNVSFNFTEKAPVSNVMVVQFEIVCRVG